MSTLRLEIQGPMLTPYTLPSVGEPERPGKPIAITTKDDGRAFFDVFAGCIRKNHAQSMDWCHLFGERVLDRVFSTSAQQAFWKLIIGQLQAQQDGTRVFIHFKDNELLDLPWEYLSLREVPDEYTTWHWASFEKGSLSRLLDSAAAADTFKLMARPVAPARALFVVASTSAASLPPLSPEKASAALAQCVGDKDLVKVDLLEDELAKVIAAEPRFDIVHILGHGKEGAVWVPNPGGYPELMTGDDLQKAFCADPAKRPALVVLQGCDTAIPLVGKDRKAGIPPLLIHNGVCAVLAMQYPVAQSVSDTFVVEFYKALRDRNRRRTVDDAVQAGRTLLMSKDDTRYAFGIPVLYVGDRRPLAFSFAEQAPPALLGGKPR